MDMSILKKALLKGIPLGLCFSVAYVLIRLLLNGGNFFDHLFSLYGILTLICIPAAWVIYFYDKEKKASKK